MGKAERETVCLFTSLRAELILIHPQTALLYHMCSHRSSLFALTSTQMRDNWKNDPPSIDASFILVGHSWSIQSLVKGSFQKQHNLIKWLSRFAVSQWVGLEEKKKTQ